MSESCSVLHLSDLHFRNSNPKVLTTTLAKIAEHVADHHTGISLVVVTGDLVCQGKWVHFESLSSALKSLCQGIGLSNHQFVFVPGNHDVNWTARSGKYKSRFHEYIAFVNGFRKGRTEGTDAIDWSGEPFASFDNLGIEGIFAPKDMPISFLLLSSVTAYRKDDKRICTCEPTNRLLQDEPQKLRDSDRLVIAAVHNPLLGFPHSVITKRKTISNAEELMAILAKCGVGLIVHGDAHDYQHAATARRLYKESWPLFTLGVGTSNQDMPGIPSFQILNISVLRDHNCAEVEVLSHTQRADADVNDDDQLCYAIHLPLHGKSVVEGSAHVFELPEEGRAKCSSKLAKDFLFEYRCNTLAYLQSRSTDLLRSGNAEITPDEMFTFFYDSLLSIAGGGDVFHAVHGQGYWMWGCDSACLRSLDVHDRAVDRGANVERIIVLTDDEIERLNDSPELRQDFSELCEELAQRRFKTFFSRDDWLKAGLKKVTAKKLGDASKDRSNTLGSISLYDCALFSRSTSSGEGQESLAFYYTAAKGKHMGAHVTFVDYQLEYIGAILSWLWGIETRQQEYASNHKMPAIIPSTNMRTLQHKFLDVKARVGDAVG